MTSTIDNQIPMTNTINDQLPNQPDHILPESDSQLKARKSPRKPHQRKVKFLNGDADPEVELSPTKPKKPLKATTIIPSNGTTGIFLRFSIKPKDENAEENEVAPKKLKVPRKKKAKEVENVEKELMPEKIMIERIKTFKKKEPRTTKVKPTRNTIRLNIAKAKSNASSPHSETNKSQLDDHVQTHKRITEKEKSSMTEKDKSSLRRTKRNIIKPVYVEDEPKEPKRSKINNRTKGLSTFDEQTTEKSKETEKITRSKKASIENKVLPEPVADLVNNEYCTACSGTGNLICCESCPKSFHFLCADPPVDQNNVPDECWFCNECMFRAIKDSKPQESGATKTVKGVWDRIIDTINSGNPKTFFLPKRIRKLVNEHNLDDKVNELISSTIKKTENKKNIDGITKKKSSRSRSRETDFVNIMDDSFEEETKVIGAQEIKIPRITDNGFCHICGRHAGNSDHTLLINCDDCTLKWHLDCLPYPLPYYPSSSRHWSCPIHLTRENLSECLSESTVNKIISEEPKIVMRLSEWPYNTENMQVSLLPEHTLKLNFGVKRLDGFDGEENTCVVPEEVRMAYEALRDLGNYDISMLKHYQQHRYVDIGVETE